MRSIRVKQVLRVAAVIDGRPGKSIIPENRKGDQQRRAGEEYAQKIIKFLKVRREN